MSHRCFEVGRMDIMGTLFCLLWQLSSAWFRYVLTGVARCMGIGSSRTCQEVAESHSADAGHEDSL